MIAGRRTAPHIVERGTLTIADSAQLRSGPTRTHIVVARDARLHIGPGTTVDFGCGIACESNIDVGADVTIGPYVQILDSAFHQTSSHRERPTAAGVSIGAGAVIGAWSMVLPGAVIEPGEVVPAGSTITARR